MRKSKQFLRGEQDGLFGLTDTSCNDLEYWEGAISGLEHWQAFLSVRTEEEARAGFKGNGRNLSLKGGLSLKAKLAFETSRFLIHGDTRPTVDQPLEDVDFRIPKKPPQWLFGPQPHWQFEEVVRSRSLRPEYH